jgi:phosphoribosylformylglycinamidine synthase
MKIALICFPGTNRGNDLYRALTYVTGCLPHKVWYTETTLPDSLDLVILPGGFAHGDRGRPGAHAAQAPIMEAIRAHEAQGRLILGICNGFQMLCEAGFLPGRLERNEEGTFISRLQWVRVERSDSPFTRLYEEAEILVWPIAHGHGNYQCDLQTLDDLAASGRIAFRYCTLQGDVTSESNPNGSLKNIAGLYSRSMRILGMMPHPENAVDGLLSSVDGRRLFLNIMESLVSIRDDTP